MPPVDDDETRDRSTEPSIAQKVGEAVEQAKETVGRAADAVRNADPKEVLQGTGEYAQKGGSAAYNAVAAHPFVAGVIGALAGYLLFRSNEPDPRDYYLDRARSYARNAPREGR